MSSAVTARHHRSYQHLGNEWLRDLVPLWRAHHEGLHRYHKQTGGCPGRSLYHLTVAYVRTERTKLRQGRTSGS